MKKKRSTKIIATIGPATESPEMLEQLVLAGLNVIRINMSHATEKQVRSVVTSVRDISKRLDRRVSILMDAQGPAIRTGDLPTKLNLNPGDRIALTVRGATNEEMASVDVNYDNLVDDIAIGDTVLVDNGEIHLKVLEKKHHQLLCQVLTEGVLGSRRHINLPGVRVNLPALTDKDVKDIELGMEVGVDFFAMSFVRDAEDVRRLRAILDYRKAPQKIIAKIEDQEGVRNVVDIIDAADAVMVARGDLGIECPFEELPAIQRNIVRAAQAVGKPVIVATHMLESMISSPSPTRAEITDVSNAVFERADAIMLSGETSVGEYPIACVEIMDRIATRLERDLPTREIAEPTDDITRLLKSASRLAEDVHAEALIVFCERGDVARKASWMRPQGAPIYTFTTNTTLLNQLPIYRGVEAFLLPDGQNLPPDNVMHAMKVLKKRNLIRSGNKIIAVTEIMLRDKLIDTIQMEEVD